MLALQVDHRGAGDAEKGKEGSRYDPRVSREARQGCSNGGGAGVEKDSHTFTSYWRLGTILILLHEDRFGVGDADPAFVDDP